MDRPDRDVDALLAGYREGDRMPAAHKDAAWARLQAAIAADDVPEDMSEAPANTSARRVGRRRAAWAIAVLLAAAVVLVLAGRELLDSREAADARQQAIHGAVGPDSEAVQTARPSAPAPAPVTTPIQAPQALPSAPRVQRPEPRDDTPDLDAELALLRSARAALSERRAADALALLGEHTRRFPNGGLVEERTLLRVQALCETGAGAQARAEAQAFARAQPDSSHAKKILRICAEGSTDPSTAGK
jgi:hypothetical protein